MAENSHSGGRLLALDVMRGATILSMILVNNPGSWGHLYPPLAHAPWFGWTPTDLIFPFFLFMVGVAMAYSFRKFEGTDSVPVDALWRVVRRTLVLLLLGLALNCSSQWLGMLFGTHNRIAFETVRLPGVLQRIALAYFGASLIVLYCGPKLRAAMGAILLLGYAALLLLTPSSIPFAERLTPEGNIVRVVDMAILGPQHMYTQAKDERTDPEGLLSTLPAIVTALLGYGAGRYLQRDLPINKKLLTLLAVGAALAALGQAWHYLDPTFGGMPISKKLWTSSFVLLTAGLGTIALTVCLYVFDVVGSTSPALRGIAAAFQSVGVNAIFAFVASGLGGRLLTMIPWGKSNFRDHFYQTVFVGPLGDTNLASLGFALTYVAFWWAILWVMWKRNWTFRV